MEAKILIPQDKANHFIYGALISFIALALMRHFHVLFAPIWTVVVAGAVGVLKEASDYMLAKRNVAAGNPPGHDVDANDILATLLGGVLIGMTGVL